MVKEPLSLMYLFDYARRSEVVLLHSHGNKVKQSPLIDRWPIPVFENLINLPRLFTCRVNKVSTVLGLFWSGRNNLKLGRNDFELGRNDLGRNDFELGRNDLGRNDLGWGETTLSWGKTTWGETDLERNDRNALLQG